MNSEAGSDSSDLLEQLINVNSLEGLQAPMDIQNGLPETHKLTTVDGIYIDKPQRPLQVQLLLLMSLLSGKQHSKAVKAKKEKARAEPEPFIDPAFFVDDETLDDPIESPDFESSFTEAESAFYKEEHNVIELEKKIYGLKIHKSVTAKDLFKQMRQKPMETKPDPTVPAVIEPELPAPFAPLVESVDIETTEANVIEINDVIEIESEEEKLSKLEDKVYSGAVKKSAKDFLGSFKTGNMTKNALVEEIIDVDAVETAPPPALPVPLSSKSGVNAFSILMRPKKKSTSVLVTLKVPSSVLRDINTKPDPVVMVKPDLTKKKVVSGVFGSMMALSRSNTVKLTPLQKLKELLPLPLTREQFHVQYDDFERSKAPIDFGLPLKTVPAHTTLLGDWTDLTLINLEMASKSANLDYLPTKIEFLDEYIHNKIPQMRNHPHLDRIYQFIASNKESNSSALWIDHFKPTKTLHLLINIDKKTQIQEWIINSFERLKTQTLATPRNVQIKKKKKKMNSGPMADFIVDDFDDGEIIPEDIFVPVLIIQGSVGVGKSASVYAALDEINGYVHEINSGQPRSRKDLYSTLKELSTTQLVHNIDSEEFQRGIILFDDTDILFEQDKTFWTVVQDIVNISRRPIIITCKDMSNIPKQIIESAQQDKAIIGIDAADNDTQIREYLWLCGMTQGYDVDDSALQSIIDKCCTSSNFQHSNYDLRQCIMQLQMTCQHIHKPRPNDGELIKITCTNLNSDREDEKTLIDGSDELLVALDRLECLSNADCIASNTITMITPHVQENEFIDFDVLGETVDAKQTLPYELNIGTYLFKEVGTKDTGYEVTKRHTYNQIRSYVTDFVSSRSRKLPKYLLENPTISRRATRSFNSNTNITFDEESPNSSFSDYNYGVTGISDFSICRHLNPLAYDLELAPFCRCWARFQSTLDKQEVETLREHNVSVKKFLGWRQFQGNPKDLLTTFLY